MKGVSQMSTTLFLGLLGASSLLVLGACLVALVIFFMVYKIDATYPELGFWANVRLEIATMLVGKYSNR
jgi:hypothetical protein